MRDELHLIELADRYLRGELKEVDRTAFEERLRTNAGLRELVDDQRVLQQGIERLALRPAVDLAYRSYRFGKWIPGLGGAVIIAVVSIGGWMAAKGGSEHDAIATSHVDTTATEVIAIPSDSMESLLVLPADTVWDTLVTTIAVSQDALVDTTIITNKAKASEVSTTVIKRIDPAPRKIIEGLTEKLDSQPMFVGGNEALRNYLIQNLRYPPQAEAKGVQGRVTISFVVASDGTVEDVQVVSGVGAGCNEEALRVVERMPKWIPGYVDGRPVGVRTTLPIVFRSSPPVMY